MVEKIFTVNVTISNVSSAKNTNDMTVIYDGECGFCKECVNWVKQKTIITALPFQSVDLSKYGVTYDRCSKELIVIKNKKVFGGADAVRQLLKECGYRNLAALLRISGPFGRRGYKWVAEHRGGILVRAATVILRRKNNK